MIRDDGIVIHFNKPKVRASIPANIFSVSGGGCYKREFSDITEMLSDILSQVGTESLIHLKKLPGHATDQFKINREDDVPDLVGNFDEMSKEKSNMEEECGDEQREEREPNKALLDVEEREHIPLEA